MTLQSSGAISFNNVNTELAVSGTSTISFNDSSARTLAGVPSGSYSMSTFYGKSGASAPVNYDWRAYVAPSGSYTSTNLMTRVVGTEIISWGVVYGYMHYQKITATTGALVSSIFYNVNALCKDMDSAGNLYTLRMVSSILFEVMKFNASGAIVWVKGITNYSGSAVCSISIDTTAAQVYILNTPSLSQRTSVTAISISTGAVAWVRYLGNGYGQTNMYPHDISSANGYVFVSCSEGHVINEYVVCFNSSGSVLWSKLDMLFAHSKALYDSTTGYTYILIFAQGYSGYPGSVPTVMAINASTGAKIWTSGQSASAGSADIFMDGTDLWLSVGGSSSHSLIKINTSNGAILTDKKMSIFHSGNTTISSPYSVNVSGGVGVFSGSVYFVDQVGYWTTTTTNNTTIVTHQNYHITTAPSSYEYIMSVPSISTYTGTTTKGGITASISAGTGAGSGGAGTYLTASGITSTTGTSPIGTGSSISTTTLTTTRTLLQ